MKNLPQITRVAENSGVGITGNFVDEEFVFHFVKSGKWSFRMEDCVYEIEPGNLILLPPFMLHVVRPIDTENLTQYVVHFELYGDLSEWQQLPMVVTIPAPIQKRISDLFKLIQREWKSPQEGSDLIASGILTEFLGIYRRYSGNSPQASPVNSPGWQNIERAISFIQTRYQDPELTIRQISKQAGQSMPYFSKLFKEYIGMSPLHYLNQYRVNRAKEIMVGASTNLSGVADQTGFASIYNFSKVFKRICGESPSEWLRKAGQ